MSDNSSDEIRRDDVVMWSGSIVHGDRFRVVHVEGDCAWVEDLKEKESRRQLILSLRTLRKVEPVFEVGKRYRYKSMGVTYEVVVTDKRGDRVIGWQTYPGGPSLGWISWDSYRSSYEEVTD